MDDGARGWLFRTAAKNYWRLASWYDLDDLIQDGYVCYCKVLSRYPDATDAPHRMALFKRTYLNWIHDLANKRTKSVQEVSYERAPSAEDDGAASVLDRAVCPAGDLAQVRVLVAAAPEYVRRALELFTTEDGLRRLRSSYRLRAAGDRLVRETMNDRLCRLLGLDARAVNVPAAIRMFLGGAEPLAGVAVRRVPAHSRPVAVERRCGGRKYRRILHPQAAQYVALCERSENHVPVDKDLRSQYGAVLRLPAVAR